MNIKFTFLTITLALIGLSLNAQTEKCATMTNLETQYLKDPTLVQRMADSEQNLQDYINQKSTNKINAVITIPVVFHIIHNGEALGTGDNIEDATIMYQLSRINEDFRKLNNDTLASTHPFYPVQADTEIEFCLATEDPDGNPTSGILRYNKNATSFTINEIDSLIKPSTIWNRNDYINIWSVNLIDPDAPGVDGYGTFPDATSDTTDGVVVATFAFGYDDATGGKTIVLTHELGHFFNLKHIWGDDTCGDDFVDDTPVAEEDNFGCPTFPHNVAGPCSPGANGEMFMNYMDYSDAVCTVMFSEGQKTRMLATLATTRSSLTTSDKCSFPLGVNEDSLNNSINVFPNPNNGNFTITLSNSEAISFAVYDIMGSEVRGQEKIETLSHNIDMTEFSEGIYFIKITKGNIATTKKIILSK